MSRLTIDFPDEEARDNFLSYFSNSGEQEYWEAMECTGNRMVSFKIDFEEGAIEAEYMEE
jgi:hypothetical protein